VIILLAAAAYLAVVVGRRWGLRRGA